MKIVLRFQRARSILGGNSMIRPRGAPRFAECLGLLSLNTDSALWHKFQWIEEDAWLLSWWDRAHLVELATRDVSWMGLSNLPESIAMHELQEDSRWKRLNFIHYYLNGADDVVKYEKWEWATETARYFTIGRPGWTAKVITGAQACGVWKHTLLLYCSRAAGHLCYRSARFPPTRGPPLGDILHNLLFAGPEV